MIPQYPAAMSWGWLGTNEWRCITTNDGKFRIKVMDRTAKGQIKTVIIEEIEE